MLYVMRTAAVVSSLTVNGTNVYYSQSFDIRNAIYFGCWLKATSGTGTPKMQIQLEQSYVLPTTEQASDSNWVVPDGLSDIVSALNDQLAHIYALSPKTLPYARFKITGLATNPTDTVLNINVATQEPGGR